jgi:Sulfotransferase family
LSEITPIFLLSLPRSGSTMVQRVLSTHPEVASTPEPWILLPLLTPLEPSMPHSRGWQASVDGAVRDFVAELPGDEDDYLAALRPFVERLYLEAAGGDARYFLDKTPPYFWIVNRLFRLFPDAKFIFLWRNPLGALASIAETFCAGEWRLDRFRGTVFDGLANLVAAYEEHRDVSFAVRYEDLIGGGESAWRGMSAYLELDFDPGSLASFGEEGYAGRLGDPTGVHLYSTLSQEPLQKWRKAIDSPLRRRWCEGYIDWLGAKRLGTMGYDLRALKADLSAADGGKHSVRDAAQLGRAAARELASRAVNGRDLGALSTWELLGAHRRSRR